MSQRTQIMEILTSLPGSTMAEIAILMPEYKNPSGEVAYLAKKGIIRSEKNQSNHNRYFINDTAETKQRDAIVLATGQSNKQIVVTPGFDPLQEELVKELKELREFKAMAIAKYPGLAIKPEIIEGRKILVEFFTRTGETNKVEMVKNGQLDHVPMMQAVIIALDK